MAKLKISRRRFLGGVLACGAAFHRASWAFSSQEGSHSKKKIDWGYPEGAIRLNSNENPLGASPRALKAMEEALGQAHRYTISEQLIKELASFHSVSKDMVLAGCGSTEFLRISPWTFLRNGGELVTSLQTYQTLLRECRRIGVKLHTLPLSKDFSYDLDSLKKALTPQTKMVYIVNPNNPTGTHLGFEELRKFCGSLPKGIIVFIDEAYAQFLEDKEAMNGVDLIKQGYNVMVSRTFSKVHGLAGIRLGYVISSESNIQKLKPFGFRSMGINQAAFAAGIASMEDEKHIQKYKELVRKGKEFFYEQFAAMDLSYIPSITPFLMVRVNIPSKTVQKKLEDKKVYVRKGEDWYMPGYLRISVGLPEENRACVEAMKRVLAQ